MTGFMMVTHVASENVKISVFEIAIYIEDDFFACWNKPVTTPCFCLKTSIL